jgi:hypothetical protein
MGTLLFCNNSLTKFTKHWQLLSQHLGYRANICAIVAEIGSGNRQVSQCPITFATVALAAAIALTLAINLGPGQGPKYALDIS